MIDWEHVKALKSDMGDAFSEVVEVFLQEVDEALGKFDPSADDATRAASMHFLKGAALNLGFSRFAKICAAAEQDAAAGKPIDLDAIEACYLQSRGDFSSNLDRRAA